MANIPDEIRSGGPEFLHKLSQLTLELLSDRDEGEFACPGVLGPLPGVVVVLEERPDEILLALLGYGFQTGVEGVIVLLYEVFGSVANSPSKVTDQEPILVSYFPVFLQLGLPR